MAEPRDDGGPAFPVADQGMHGTYGMSLRDFFAAQALAPMLIRGIDYRSTPNEMARSAYDMADAMLQAKKA